MVRRPSLTSVAGAGVLIFALLLTLPFGALTAGCRVGGEPVSEDGSGGPRLGDYSGLLSYPNGGPVALVRGQPDDGSVLAYLPPGSYTLSPTGRYLVRTEAREEEPASMYYRPVVYDVGGLLTAGPPLSPIELAQIAPDLWLHFGYPMFWDWVLGDQALAIGDSRRVVLWWPETGKAEVLREHPDSGPSEYAYHGGAVSPDGRSLALAVSGSNGMIRIEQVFLEPSLDSIEVQATVTLVAELEGRTLYPGAGGFPYEEVSLTWAPDGLSLAVSVQRRQDGNDPGSWFWEVSLLRLGPEPPAMTPLVADARARSWSPDGGYLIVEPTVGGQTWRVVSVSGATVLTLHGMYWWWVPGGVGLLAYEEDWAYVVSLPNGTAEPLIQGQVIDRLPDGRWLWLSVSPGP